MQKWFVRNLPLAKEVLKNFKLLNALLDGLKGYENKHYRNIRNAIMFMCLPKIGRGGIDLKSVNRLSEIEKTLELFDVMRWSASKRNYLKSRLASEKYIDSFSAVTELEIASKMVSRFGKENVELYPMLEGRGFSDTCVKINGKNVFLEVGNLGESLPESKIQKILDASAKYLGEKIDDLVYLCLTINTAELVFDKEGRIDVDSSIKKLNSEIDMLKIYNLAEFEGFFDFDKIAYILTNQSLYRKFEKLWTQGDQRLMGLISDKKIKRWLDGFDTALLSKAKLAKGIISGKMNSTMLVEIHTEEFYPSKATSLELKSFLNHLDRHVESQLNQLQPETPNIVVVQGWHWTMLFSLDTLYESIKKFFEERKKSILVELFMDQNLRIQCT